MTYSKILQYIVEEFEHCYIWGTPKLFEYYANELHNIVPEDYKEIYLEMTSILIDELRKGG